VTVLPLGMHEARAAANARATLERVGTPMGPLDTLIAGIALADNATLVTHDTAEFSRASPASS
jgi:tRNA(fMet)-specific endonuclease VapC